jgi:hypothetical protein
MLEVWTVRRPYSGVATVARTVPASKDGMQLGRVKCPCVLAIRIAHEPAKTSGAVEEPGRRRPLRGLTDGQRRDERAFPPSGTPGLPLPDGLSGVARSGIRIQRLLGNTVSTVIA